MQLQDYYFVLTNVRVAWSVCVSWLSIMLCWWLTDIDVCSLFNIHEGDRKLWRISSFSALYLEISAPEWIILFQTIFLDAVVYMEGNNFIKTTVRKLLLSFWSLPFRVILVSLVSVSRINFSQVKIRQKLALRRS